MLDDLRNAAIQEDPQDEGAVSAARPRRNRRRGGKQFLGMTAPQRFIIAVMILLLLIVFSVMCLMVTGRLWI
jgi:hypothetical protein